MDAGPERLDRDGSPVLDGVTIETLLQALASGPAGICLCDDQDEVRYANRSFVTAFFADLPDRPANFVDALALAIRNGRGIRLDSMPLEAFVPRVKERRKTGSPRYDFTVDLFDGSWWWVNDHRLPNGWMLVVATEISPVKHEEIKLRTAHAEAVREAHTDFLTGLANRRRGIEWTEQALEDFRTNRLPLAVAILDLDHFKAINDADGHETGDQVLVRFARDLQRELGTRDQVSRIGGEEFLVVMPGASLARAEQKLNGLARIVRPVDKWDGNGSVSFTFSGGLASARMGDTVQSLLSRADAALYLAKIRGRDRIEVSRHKDSHAA